MSVIIRVIKQPAKLMTFALSVIIRVIIRVIKRHQTRHASVIKRHHPPIGDDVTLTLTVTVTIK